MVSVSMMDTPQTPLTTLNQVSGSTPVTNETSAVTRRINYNYNTVGTPKDSSMYVVYGVVAVVAVIMLSTKR